MPWRPGMRPYKHVHTRNCAAAVEQSCSEIHVWHWKHHYIPIFVPQDYMFLQYVSIVFLYSQVGGWVCVNVFVLVWTVQSKCWAMSTAYKSRSKAFMEHPVNWVHWTVCMCLRTAACLQMSALFFSQWIKDIASLSCVLVGGLLSACVCMLERQSKPVWSDKLEFNWLWWGYKGHIRRRTDKKQRWFPFLLTSFTVLTERAGTCHLEPKQQSI